MSLRERVTSWLESRALRAERRAAVYGLNRRNIELIYRYNPRRFYPIADNKLLAKSYLSRQGVAVPETLAVCRGLFEVQPTVARLRAESNFVVKPNNGSGGAGIAVLGARSSDGWINASGELMRNEELVHHLAHIVFGAYTNELEDQALIERRVSQHEMLHELWPHGVSDIRVLVLENTPRMAMLRVPTHRSRGKANLHQGGLGVAIDVATGRTTRAVAKRTAVTRHPESGIPLLGLCIPHWQEVVDLAVRAAASVPLAYLGVDIVIDRAHGPLVLEINARPGLEIQNVNGVPLGAVIPVEPMKAP